MGFRLPKALEALDIGVMPSKREPFRRLLQNGDWCLLESYTLASLSPRRPG